MPIPVVFYNTFAGIRTMFICHRNQTPRICFSPDKNAILNILYIGTVCSPVTGPFAKGKSDSLAPQIHTGCRAGKKPPDGEHLHHRRRKRFSAHIYLYLLIFHHSFSIYYNKSFFLLPINSAHMDLNRIIYSPIISFSFALFFSKSG